MGVTLKDFWDLQKKRSALARLEQAELLSLQQQYEWYLLTEQKLHGLKDSAVRRKLQTLEGVSSHLSFEHQEPPDATIVGSAIESLGAVTATLNTNAATEQNCVNSLNESLCRIEAVAENAASELSMSFSMFRENVYTPKVNELAPEDREILTRQIQILEETKRLPLVENECEKLLREVISIAEELKNLCYAICNTRNHIVETREKLITTLNADMTNIRLRFLRSANQDAKNRFQSRYGEEGIRLVGYLQNFGNSESYQNLHSLFSKLASLRIEQDQWDVNDLLWDVKLIDLLDVFDEDDIEISLAVGNAGLVPIQNLSAGQRCVAVFPLLLRNSRGPLIIDQPEDNLYNRYIADIITPDLLRRKQNQQFMVTSHNANLVVLADADLIIHVDSDGTTSKFPACGFLSCRSSEVRQSVLDVLDGGEAALAARQRKYGSQ